MRPKLTDVALEKVDAFRRKRVLEGLSVFDLFGTNDDVQCLAFGPAGTRFRSISSFTRLLMRTGAINRISIATAIWARSGRSLAREIEYRLEQSFEIQELKDTVRPLASQLGELQKNFVIHTHKKIVVNVHNSTDRPIVLVIPGDHEQGRYERELVMNLAGGEAAAKLPTELDELERKPSEGKATDELALNRSRKRSKEAGI
jgi:hypothetical protein